MSKKTTTNVATEFEQWEARMNEIKDFIPKYPINEIMYYLSNCDNRLALMNWFYKDHIEKFVGEEIDNNVMLTIREHQEYYHDYYSEVFSEIVKEIYEEQIQNTPAYIAAHRARQINSILED